jgi:pimeloyl-ACP methyl ester carboxylesterase
MIMAESTGLREGYADVGDQRLHYVEAGEGPLVVLLHGFPEFWYGWRRQIEPLAAAGFRVVAPDTRGYNLSSKPDGVAAYDTGKLAADIRDLIHERGGESALRPVTTGADLSLGHAMNHPEVGPAGHPQRSPPAETLSGTAPPGPAPQVLVFLLLRLPELPEAVVHADHWRFFRDFLRDADPAYTPEEIERYVEAWSQPGAATGMINYYRSSVRTSPGAPKLRSARSRRQPWSSGDSGIASSAKNWPSPTATMSPVWTASSVCPTPPTGSITTRLSASHNCSPSFSLPPCQP